MNETLEQVIRGMLASGKTAEQTVATLKATPPWNMFREAILRAVVDSVAGRREPPHLARAPVLAAKHAIDRLIAHRKVCEICEVALEAQSVTFPPCPVGVVRHRQHVKALRILDLELRHVGISLEGLFIQFLQMRRGK